jgi:hypothetical protein
MMFLSGALQGSGGGFPLRPSDFKRDTGGHMAIITIKGYEVLIDDENIDKITSRTWNKVSLGDKGRVYFWTETGSKRTKRKYIYLHRMIMDVDDRKIDIDHINMNTLDNRKSNLRKCTRSQNMANSGFKKNNTSGFKGVYWNKNAKKWVAQITHQRVNRLIGYYDDKILAHDAYAKEAKKLFGDFARTE